MSHRKEFPRPSHAFQLVLASFIKLDPRAEDQGWDRGGHKRVSWSGERHDPSSDVHGDAPNVLAAQLDFTRVKSYPYIDPKLATPFTYRAPALDSAGGAVECGKESVTHCLDLSAFEASELTTHHGIMRIEKILPRPITDGCRPPCGVDDVAEQDCRQRSIEIAAGRQSGEELFGAVQEGPGSFTKEDEIRIGQ
jgi:hypothetical protein